MPAPTSTWNTRAPLPAVQDAMFCSSEGGSEFSMQPERVEGNPVQSDKAENPSMTRIPFS